MLLFFGAVVIAFLEGQVFLIENGYAVIRPGGVGYQVYVRKKDLDALVVGDNVSLFIYTHIREDAFDLYGFATNIERQIFLQLISVSGVGPKLALTMLSSLEPASLLDALINKDIALLSSVPGIGKKTAERLSLELKDKAMKMDYVHLDTVSPSSVRTSLEQAIKSLGYTKSQSDKAILALEQGDLASLPLEDLIKKTLTVLAGTKS